MFALLVHTFEVCSSGSQHRANRITRCRFSVVLSVSLGRIFGVFRVFFSGGRRLAPFVSSSGFLFSLSEFRSPASPGAYGVAAQCFWLVYVLEASEQNGKHTGGLVVSRPRGLDFHCTAESEIKWQQEP